MPELQVILWPAVAVGVILSTAAPASAETQKIKPGLWNFTQSTAGIPVNVTGQVCFDGSEGPRFTPLPAATLRRERDHGCTQVANRRLPDGYSTEALCKKNGRITHLSTTMRGDPQRSYQTGVSMSSGDGPALASTTSYRWVGPCLPGMKPGQLVIDQRDLAAAAGRVSALRP